MVKICYFNPVPAVFAHSTKKTELNIVLTSLIKEIKK